VTNAKQLFERLVTLLATRTGGLEDALAVERELARVREEIERYGGRMQFLKTRTAVSTLTITVHETLPLPGQTPGADPIIASLGILVPVAVLGVGGGYMHRRNRAGRT